ncbi:MAG: hypothetical protein KAR06_00360 [Deltaproteobacteria bacterium]|nr:hypothetical protein [Deltaproteobacteria bacterium]
MGLRRGSKKGAEKKKFQYKKRTADSLKKRAAQGGGTRDGILRDDLARFTPNKDANRLRVLPPTYDGADHWGMDVWVHWGIGPDKNAYICLSKMKGEDCPICEERVAAIAEGEEDYAKQIAAKRRVLVWLIDRDNEKEGPQLWAMPWTIDRDVCNLSSDSRTGEVFDPADPDGGYDIEFSKEGEKDRTRYNGIQIARRSTPLGNDEALEYVVEHPLPDCLNFYDYDHIAGVFSGHASKEETAGEEEKSEEKPETREKEDDIPDSHVGSGKTVAENSEDPLTWAEVHELSADDLRDALLEEGVDQNDINDIPEDELADAACELFNIKKPEEKKGGWRDRLNKVKAEAKE